MFKIYIIILTFNNEKTIEALLSSLSVFKSGFKIIVVDNKSSDKTISKVKKYPQIILIENKKNIGFSAGNNIGIKYALNKKADIVFLLNPDTVVHKDFLRNFDVSTKKLLESNDIIGTKVFSEDGKIWSIGGMVDKKRYSSYLLGYGQKDSNKDDFTMKIDYVSATAIFIKKEVFEKIGFLKEDYFLYYEDVDFCQRARKSGFKLAIDKNISIIHKASSSVGKNSPVMQYYMARNHMLFVERFAPLTIKIRELVRLPKTIYQARNKKHELIGIGDYFLRRFGKSAYWS